MILDIDIERVRVGAEHDACARLLRTAWHVPEDWKDAATRRLEVLTTALLLTESMAPEAYAAARDAMAALGVEDTLELYQSTGRGYDTARLAVDGAPIGIELLGGYLGSLDHGGLTAVIGHEIGHALAHKRVPRFARAFAIAQQASSHEQRAYAMAAELTADRFGLIACRDLDAALRLEMRSAAGRAAVLRFDTEAYARQCRAVAEEILAKGATASGATHPPHYVRGYALCLFAETDEFGRLAKLAGRGRAKRTIDDVDATLAKLLGIRAEPEWTLPVAPLPAPPVRLARPERAPRAARGPSLEALAVDILADGARRKLADASRALAKVAGLDPEPARRESGIHPTESVPSWDPLEDDDRELLARFEELERKAASKGK